MTKQGLTIAVIAILFFLLFLGASPLFVVDVTQTAIVVQLGKPVRIVMEPGLYIKVPFVQEVTYFDKRLLDYDSDAQDVITQDKRRCSSIISPSGASSILSRSIKISKVNAGPFNGCTISSIPSCGWN
jgi:regulator of protease activity HflC (stomatin/prohibitin superfamily)